MPFLPYSLLFFNIVRWGFCVVLGWCVPDHMTLALQLDTSVPCHTTSPLHTTPSPPHLLPHSPLIQCFTLVTTQVLSLPDWKSLLMSLTVLAIFQPNHLLMLSTAFYVLALIMSCVQPELSSACQPAAQEIHLMQVRLLFYTPVF